MTNLPATVTRPEVWAEVRAHDHVVRYCRTGTGPCVLVLRATDGSQALWPELLDALEPGFRLIRPELPDADERLAARLAGFLEGLGIARVAVLATEPFCTAALDLARLDPERVASVVLVAGERADGVTTPSRGRGLRLLVVRRALAAGEAVPRILRVLAEPGSARAH
jgi:hypothetical protein